MAGIYLHVPFCHAKCAYCDFYSIANSAKVDDYIRAVAKEYMSRRSELGAEPVGTLYFGGGTPSMLSGEQFSRLAKLLYSSTIEEFTIEVNPEDVSPDKIGMWQDCGVNRVSIGVQSLVDDELRAVRRRHSGAEALSAICMLQRRGISNISADLIYGLPGQTLESWSFSLRTLLETGICHLSAYCLSYEVGTLLYRRLKDGLIEEMPDEMIEMMYRNLCGIVAEYGFGHYEISNFALAGFRSRHNSNYWRSVPYLGLGPSAHSLEANGTRRYNLSSLHNYIASPETATNVDEEDEVAKLNDRIMVALRTAEGLSLDSFTPAEADAILERAAPWRASAYLQLSAAGNRLYIPENHWLLADAVIRDLFFG